MRCRVMGLGTGCRGEGDEHKETGHDWTPSKRFRALDYPKIERSPLSDDPRGVYKLGQAAPR